MSAFWIFLILIMVVSILLVLVIMVQNPKGGGLSSSFGGGGNQVIGGVKKTGDFLDKSTWLLATILISLILLSNTVAKEGRATLDSKLLENQNTENTIPAETQNDELPSSTKDTTGTN